MVNSNNVLKTILINKGFPKIKTDSPIQLTQKPVPKALDNFLCNNSEDEEPCSENNFFFTPI